MCVLNVSVEDIKSNANIFTESSQLELTELLLAIF